MITYSSKPVVQWRDKNDTEDLPKDKATLVYLDFGSRMSIGYFNINTDSGFCFTDTFPVEEKSFRWALFEYPYK